MASKNPDAWLWVGLIVVGYFGSLAIHNQLESIRRDAEITKGEQPVMVSRRTENAIKLETLGQLAQSANPDVKAASVRIMTERAFQGGPVWNLLLSDLSSSDSTRREKALTSLCFLSKEPPLCSRLQLITSKPTVPRRPSEQGAQLYQLSTATAVITCLCNLLPDARIAEKERTYLPQPHIDALLLLQGVTIRNSHTILQAGLVSRWLTRFPFGGENASKKEKRDIIRKIVQSTTGDEWYGPDMATICFYTVIETDVRREMVKHGLWDASFDDVIKGPGPDTVDISSSPPHFHQRFIPNFISQSFSPNSFRGEQPHYRDNSTYDGDGFAPASARRREESFEEQALRRRRREAMVLGESGRPIQRDDIIEREDAVTEANVGWNMR